MKPMEVDVLYAGPSGQGRGLKAEADFVGHSSTSSIRPNGSVRRSAGHANGSVQQLLPDSLPACCAGAGRVRSSSSFVPATEIRALAWCRRACDSAATFLALFCVPRGANACGRTVVRPFSVLL